MTTPSNQSGSFTSQDAELTEQRNLSKVIELTRLEEKAKRPSFILDGWNLSIMIGVPIVLYLQGRHAALNWLVPLLLLKLIHSLHCAVHSRIDALLELGRLKGNQEAEHVVGGNGG